MITIPYQLHTKQTFLDRQSANGSISKHKQQTGSSSDTMDTSSFHPVDHESRRVYLHAETKRRLPATSSFSIRFPSPLTLLPTAGLARFVIRLIQNIPRRREWKTKFPRIISNPAF